MSPDEDPELNYEDLSPLVQMMAPKVILCRIREYQDADFEACVDIHRSNQPDFLKPDSLGGFMEFLTFGTTYFLV
eukprot:gene1616-2020_t